MPLCISCRGEYWVPPDDEQQTQPGTSPPDRAPAPDESQPPDQSSSTTGGAPPAAAGLARVYNRKDLPPYICARCGQSNERWHGWATAGGVAHFTRFFLGFWGVQALVSFALPILAAVAVDFTPVASERIGIPLALVLIFVNVSLLYALRHTLWRYDLLSKAGGGLRPPLALLAITTFVLALVFGLAIVFMLEARAATPEAGWTTGLVRVTTTILLSMTFVNVTLSAIFMSAYDYGQWLNREMPQPIYAQERRLLSVIEDGLEQEIREATGGGKTVESTITGIERTADAGVILSIRAVTDSEEKSGEDRYKEMQKWTITADRWGRIRKMQPEGPPQYIKVPADAGAKKEEDKAADGEPPKPAKEGELLLPGEESYHTRSETTVAITSKRRHWMQ